MPPKLRNELDLACTAVQHTALLTKRVQQSLLQSDSISKKDDSPVTAADFALQALLTAAIHGAFPDDEFLAEECADDLRLSESLLDRVWQLIESVKPAFQSSEPPLAVPKSKADVLDLIDLGGKNESSIGNRTWCFDPIDGTATFITGQQYAINCAFLVNGEQQIGIIGCPNIAIDASTVHEDDIDMDGLGLIIFAVRGEGAWKRPLQPNANLAPAIRISRHGDTAALDKLIWTDCSTYTSTILDLHRQVAAKLGAAWPGLDLYSSLIKYAALGLGSCSVCLRIFKFTSWRSNLWDHAGGVLIFEEAGGKVTDLNGKSIDFTKGRKISENYGLVCAPSSVHADVLKVVQEVLKAHGAIPRSR